MHCVKWGEITSPCPQGRTTPVMASKTKPSHAISGVFALMPPWGLQKTLGLELFIREFVAIYK